METQRFTTVQDMQVAAAALVLDLARESVAARGRFCLALSGGRTPKGLYELLAQSPARERMPWGQSHFFMGDERLVPLDHEHSNYGQAWRELLSRVPVPAENLHPMPVDFPEPAQAARAYAEELTHFFGGQPILDLCLLGLGPDGHTASLFPDRLALDAIGLAAVEPEPGLAPHVARLTLTFPVINASRVVLLCATGQEKLDLLQELSASPEQADEKYPVALVRPAGRLVWFLAP